MQTFVSSIPFNSGQFLRQFAHSSLSSRTLRESSGKISAHRSWRRSLSRTVMTTTSPIIGNPTPLVDKVDTRAWKLDAPESETRRVLSCDGGGMRGVMSAAMLTKMEQDLQEYTGNPHYRLGHYFDVVGGTSTGSILATWVALGLEMKKCLELYMSDEGAGMFEPARFIDSIPFFGTISKNLATKYKVRNLEKTILKYVGDTKMDSKDDRFLCDLVICAKNATTGRTVFFNSNPDSRWYYQTKDLNVRDLIRGSSAAPTYFPPKKVWIYDRHVELIDGGVSYNNPSFPVFLECVHKGHGHEFAAREDRLLFMSVGTGYAETIVDYAKSSTWLTLQWAPYLITRIMEDSSLQQVALMELIGYCPNVKDKNGDIIKGTARKLSEDKKEAGPGMFGMKHCTYYRFGTALSEQRLRTLLGNDEDFITRLTDPLGGVSKAVERVKEMDGTSKEYRQLLVEIGKGLLRERYDFQQLKDFMPKSTAKTGPKTQSIAKSQPDRVCA